MRMFICADLAHSQSGPDAAQHIVPYNLNDGISSVIWKIRQIDLAVNEPAGDFCISLEKSTGVSAFVPVKVGLARLKSNATRGCTKKGLGTVESGDKLRLNGNALPRGRQLTVSIVLEPDLWE